MKKILLIFQLFIFLNGCERDKPTEPDDNGVEPAKPEGLYIYYASEGAIGLEWRPNSESDIEGYKIYRSPISADSLKAAGFTNEYYYEDYGLNYDSVYYYSVTAIDKSGKESAFSSVVSARPANRSAPSPPRSTAINARNFEGELSVNLSWLPPFDADVSGYNIYRSDSSGFSPDSSNLHDFSDWSSYTDTRDLQILKTYYYQVRTVDRGQLESRATDVIGDYILDRPELLSPGKNYRVNPGFMFAIIGCAAPASYKLVVHDNPVYGPIRELNFTSEIPNDTITVDPGYYFYSNYSEYFWEVYAYTSGDKPNSYSQRFSFTVIP